MLKQSEQKNFIYWSFISLFIYTLLLELPILSISPSNFFFLLYISLSFLLVLYFRNYWKRDIPPFALITFNLLLVCNLIAIVRAIVSTSNYLDWKHTLVNEDGGISLLVPFAMVSSFHFINNKKLLQLCINIFKYSFFLIPIALAFSTESYPRMVTPVIVFIILSPYFKEKERFIILTVAVISVAIAISWRTNVLHILISFSLLMVYYLRKWASASLLTVVHLCLFLIPLYFLNQGINGDSIFSRMKNSEYSIKTNGEEIEFTADTRTALYEEVFKDLNVTNSLWLGKGSTGKYKTEYDYDLLAEMGNERSSVEVGFLRILINTGILGFVLYTILLLIAVFYGTFRTKNTLSKLLALLVASHWAMLFIEEATVYNLYYYFTWIVVGLCFSREFRNLSDDQLKEWLR